MPHAWASLLTSSLHDNVDFPLVLSACSRQCGYMLIMLATCAYGG